MSRKFLEYDAANIRLGRGRVRIGRILFHAVAYLAITVSFTVLLYGLFSIFFRTDVEERLHREIKSYERIYSSLVPKEELVGDAITYLQYRDNRIYKQVFHSDAPATDPMSRSAFLFDSDTVPETRLYGYTGDKADSLIAVASKVDDAFGRIFRILADSTTCIPPMRLPVEDISYSQVGASVGKKMDPFYQAYIFHKGIDFVVPRGCPVFAAGTGTVSSVTNSKKSGRTVEVLHEGGFLTRYAHMETVAVRVGDKVASGAKIGTSGMSGRVFAPHLHYELVFDGRVLDPVHYLFASLTPSEYANMLYMAVNTMQSMD